MRAGHGIPGGACVLSRLTPTRRPPLQPRGFTLIELVVVMVVLGILASLAMPAYLNQTRRLRRSDGVTALARLQQAQERWRAQHPAYAASLGADGLNTAGTSPAGHYALSTDTSPDTLTVAYRLTATAQGAQADDADCRWLVITVDRGQLTQRSGPDAQVGNGEGPNRACWSS